MGFMGLKSVYEVDGASDLLSVISGFVQEKVEAALYDKGNEYNPPGIINILLIVKEHPGVTSFLSEDLIERIDYYIEKHVRTDEWPALERQVKSLVTHWKCNEAVKKVICD